MRKPRLHLSTVILQIVFIEKAPCTHLLPHDEAVHELDGHVGWRVGAQPWSAHCAIRACSQGLGQDLLEPGSSEETGSNRTIRGALSDAHIVCADYMRSKHEFRLPGVRQSYNSRAHGPLFSELRTCVYMCEHLSVNTLT